MHRIRQTMFETNSSAVHSIVIKGDLEENKIPVTPKGNIHVNLHYYGKEYNLYPTQQEKFEYAATIVAYEAVGCCPDDGVPAKEKCEDSYYYIAFCNAIRKRIPQFTGRLIFHSDGEWGFNHQAVDDWPVNIDWEDDVINFIWNPNIVLKTDSD